MFLFKNISCQNLIQNPSFEIYTAPVNCSGASGGFDNYSVFPINHVVDYWYSLNSPDYFSSLCSGLNNDGSPINIFGNSYAKQGSNYVGGIFFQANYETKEYIYQQLSNPLQAGKIYCLSFHISRADRITHAIHSIGAYFSNNVQSTATLGYVNVIPQIVNQVGFLTDTTNWIQIQGCYTAIGGEQYITIGNFNSNANTDTVFVGSSNPEPGSYKYAYYYIDDLTLIDQSNVGVKVTSSELGEMSVYPNPTNDILNISLNSTNYNNSYIELKDVYGKVLISLPYTNQIDISNFSQGLYFLYVKSNVSEKVIKIIKQ